MAEHYLYALMGAHSTPIASPLPRPLLCSSGGLWSVRFPLWGWLVGQDSLGLYYLFQLGAVLPPCSTCTGWCESWPAPAPPRAWRQPQPDSKPPTSRFCLKKIRKVYQQKIDRQSSPAEWKINWSSKTATCCSCLHSDCTMADHFSASATCHQRQS